MSGERILLVDDNLPNTELVRFLLEQNGMQVQVAESALAALARIPSFEPQLILMDIQMPGMDGLELTRRLKAHEATRDIVIVAFTAYAMKGDEDRMRAAGCDAYLTKPIDVQRFAEQVRAHLRPH
ncbi:MAG: response regulator [Betaproteobacteria bacterium]|jgi:two-component system, cell cycle response regulator DivK|nr:response regulator [Betaproteobacteria bacterium]NBS46206.1 response regulator [Betaproteobacteria bacterium]